MYKEVIVAGLPDATATANWGFANAAASLTLALLAPLLGALADYRGRKKQFFATFLALRPVLWTAGHNLFLLATTAALCHWRLVAHPGRGGATAMTATAGWISCRCR